MNLELVIYVLIFTFIGSILSLLGGLFLFWKKLWQGESTIHLLAFAAGVLLAAAFLDLLPEAVKETSNLSEVFSAALAGMIVFFFLERFLLWFHHSDREHYEHHQEAHKEKPIVWLIILGDSLHNFIDGVVIAASFLVSIPLGITTTLAVAAHEIPQEIADFSILIASGVKIKKAIFLNVLSALTAIVGSVLTLFIFTSLERYLGSILGFTAGMFLYIGGANLIPELHHAYLKDKKWHQAFFLLFGVAAIWLVTNLLGV